MRILSYTCISFILIFQSVYAQVTKIESPGGVEWISEQSYDGAFLRVTGPVPFVWEKTFSAEDELYLDMSEMAAKLADGQYSYEIFVFSKEITNISTSSGSFRIKKGRGVDSRITEQHVKDTVLQDDHIVTGSSCIGFDCVNGESFGFDTLRLKENNTRVHFNDTSNSASFPGNDWRLIANDSSNGGASYFAIEDSTHGYKSFQVSAAAGANALTVSSQGNMGVGTINAQQDVHVLRGDTPAMRFEQNAGSGFAPQVWEMGGNETQFFIRNTSAQASMPFRILTEAPTGLLTVGDAASPNRVTIDGELYIGANQLTPDYVFESSYNKLSIAEHAQLMRKNKHLPAVNAAIETQKGTAVINLSQRSQGVLEELEVAHLYIDELNQRLIKLEEKLERLELDKQDPSSITAQ